MIITSNKEWREAIHQLENKYARTNCYGDKKFSTSYIDENDPLFKAVKRFVPLMGNKVYKAVYPDGTMIAASSDKGALIKELQRKHFLNKNASRISATKYVNRRLKNSKGKFNWGSILVIEND